MLRLLDLSPLRDDPAFRGLWASTTWQMLGGQVSAFAILFQMWETTGSTLMTGAVGLVVGAATVAFGLWGGALADRRDRRTLMVIANVGALLCAVALVVQALANVTSPVVLLALAAGQAGSVALGQPARRAMVPDILPRDRIGAGIALSYASFHGSMLVGPVIAGGLTGIAGLAESYVLVLLAFWLAFPGLRRLPRTEEAGGQPNPEGDGILAGLTTITARPILRGTLLTDLAAMLMAMPVALFPALNEVRFEGAPETLGLFLAALAAGGVAATALSGGVSAHPRPGKIQLIAAATWGVALLGAGLVPNGWATLACIAAAGAADTVAAMTRATIVQLSCPPKLRGRVVAAEQVVGIAAPQVGNFRAGALGTILPIGVALAAGGALCAVSVLVIARTHPSLTKFRVEDTT
ncbi:MFS transporter [Jannaschia marina]|uniref:MFS transporter n=1 Tax=Jannaschia marina TaxID=2741674 RepID=UPI0015C89F4B|nr:MFS transporter [Jannaschia marina]